MLVKLKNGARITLIFMMKRSSRFSGTNTEIIKLLTYEFSRSCWTSYHTITFKFYYDVMLI
jgi:hypothetical protein